MALKLFSAKDGAKTYVFLNNIEVVRNEGKKAYVKFSAIFNSKYKDSSGEEKQEDPFFINGCSFSDSVIKDLENREKAYGSMTGKIITESYQKDGKKMSAPKLMIAFFDIISRKEDSDDSPF